MVLLLLFRWRHAQNFNWICLFYLCCCFLCDGCDEWGNRVSIDTHTIVSFFFRNLNIYIPAASIYLFLTFLVTVLLQQHAPCRPSCLSIFFVVLQSMK